MMITNRLNSFSKIIALERGYKGFKPRLSDSHLNSSCFVFQDHGINFRDFIQIKIVDKYHSVLSSRLHHGYTLK